jgi:A/G-specific adenine glycosylase
MNSSEYSSFRRKLIRWYSQQARDLPWRRTTDPYVIWISEIMLQQTTVVAVVPYFKRFLERFPTVRHLAQAGESEVLRLWEGLGYYSRARNLHKAANVVITRYDGRFPADVDTLRSLPGIGRYTAGAIASFAFDQRAPIVEANTLRLYCRLLGYADNPRSSAGQQVLWDFAQAILPEVAPGRVNQAMMELGATVCAPREPACDSCPVHQYCAAFHEGTQSSVPLPKTRVAITDVREVSIAIQKGTEYLLRKRTSDERWAGLWDFVRFEIDGKQTTTTEQLVESIRERTGLSVELGPQVAEFKHSVTRYRITLLCFTARRTKGRLRSDEDWQWICPETFEDFPLSVTGRKFAERLKAV